MAHKPHAPNEPPLQVLLTLETNLKRERRVFAMVIALLIFTAVCAAAVTAVSLLASTLRHEQRAAPSLDTHVNAALVQSQNVLTTAHLLLEMSAQGGPGRRRPPCLLHPFHPLRRHAIRPIRRRPRRRHCVPSATKPCDFSRGPATRRPSSSCSPTAAQRTAIGFLRTQRLARRPFRLTQLPASRKPRWAVWPHSG